MLAATKVNMGGAAVKKKINKNKYDISSIKRVTKKFPESKSKCLFCKGQCIPSSAEVLDVSRCIQAHQRQRNVQKSVLHVQSCFFAN